jgi:cytoskeletal protein RodZ
VDAIEPDAQRTGATLATARKAAGIELEELAAKTRVPLRHLKAIDVDDHSNLPALPYAIGFVKAYAKAVGLDPDSVANQFRAETSKTAHVPSVPSLEPLDERRVPSRGLVLASIAIIVAIIAGLSAWGAGMFDPSPRASPAVIAAGPEKLRQADVQADVAPPGDIGVAATPGAGVAAAGPAAPAAAVPPPPASAAGQVVLTATEDVWVKIYDRATRTSAKIGILKAGESFAVPAEPPGLLLWTGKAGALAVTVGGRPLPPLGGPVQTIRDVSLAAADLLARSAPPAVAPAAPVVPAATPAAVPSGY